MSEHIAIKLMNAHLADHRSTVQSVGVLYTLLIGATPKLETEDWVKVHAAMKDRFLPKDSASWVKKLDQIKQVGWRLHESVAQ